MEATPLKTASTYRLESVRQLDVFQAITVIKRVTFDTFESSWEDDSRKIFTLTECVSPDLLQLASLGKCHAPQLFAPVKRLVSDLSDGGWDRHIFNFAVA